MILTHETYEDPKTNGYATLLVADYHLEYPLPVHNHYPHVELAWNNSELSDLHSWQTEDGDGEDLMEKVFPKLEQQYDGYFDYNMSLWLVRGSIDQIFKHLNVWFEQVFAGPQGGDDDTFDYWPNAYDMAVVILKNLDELDGGDRFRTYLREATVKLTEMDIPEWEGWEG